MFVGGLRDMIEIDIKLVPFGIRDRERLLGRMTIWNDGTGDYKIGNYGYKIVIDGNEEFSGKYKGFNRMTKHGAMALAKEILNQIEDK